MRLCSLLLPCLFGCASSGTASSPDDAGSPATTHATTSGPDEGPDRDTADSGDSGEPGLPVQLFINELMPANGGAVEVGDASPDWLELFNPGDEPVSLDGFSVTDDLDEPRQAPLPDGLEVPAGGFLVLYASGDTSAPDHLPFKLSAEGEALGLFFPDASPADQVEFGAVPTNLALARVDDGSADWAITASPTPGAPNVID